MCVYSMIMDHYHDKWNGPWRSPPVFPPYDPDTVTPVVPAQPALPESKPVKLPTQEEIDEFYELLRKARKYDEENNQRDCESEDKTRKLKELARELGFELKKLPHEDE